MRDREWRLASMRVVIVGSACRPVELQPEESRSCELIKKRGLRGRWAPRSEMVAKGKKGGGKGQSRSRQKSSKVDSDDASDDGVDDPSDPSQSLEDMVVTFT